VIDIAISRFI